MPIEFLPAGRLLLVRNKDVPGVFGRIGTVLGRAGVNIAEIRLGRSAPDADDAVSVIKVDSAVPPAAVEEIRAIPEVLTVRPISV